MKEKLLEIYRNTPIWQRVLVGVAGVIFLVNFIYKAGYPWNCEQAKYAARLAESKESYGSNMEAWSSGQNWLKAQQDQQRLCK